MTKKIDPKDNSANMPNPNKGTSGTNKQYDQVQGNRGKQMDPHRQVPPVPAHRKSGNQ
jgi:hypothetical protein